MREKRMTEESAMYQNRWKRWGRAFVVFLVLMWVCTIVSKSIYVSKLPVVSVQTLEKKYVEHIVEAAGIVTAGGEIAVSTVPGLRVSSVAVQEGDGVPAGGLLFCVDLEDLKDIIADKERNLTKLQYQLADVLAAQAASAQARERATLWAKEDYDRMDQETEAAVERARKAIADAEDDLQKHLDARDSWGTVSGSDISANGNDAEGRDAGEAEMAAAPAQGASAWQQQKEILEKALQNAREGLENAVRERESALWQKRREIVGAETAVSPDSTAAVYQLEIDAQQKELAPFYALREQCGEVRSEREGLVSKMLISVGGRTADTAAVLLTDAQAPCQFKFSIAKEQAKYLRLGDKVKIKIGGASEVEAQVDYWAENMAGGYDYICRLPKKTGQPGMGGSVTRAVQGELFTTVLPVEALFGEKEVFYIYVLKEKNGILGKEAYVEKRKVRVEDQNDRYVALEAGMAALDEKIVTYSTGELKQGASVRVLE